MSKSKAITGANAQPAVTTEAKTEKKRKYNYGYMNRYAAYGTDFMCPKGIKLLLVANKETKEDKFHVLDLASGRMLASVNIRKDRSNLTVQTEFDEIKQVKTSNVVTTV